MPVFGCPRPVIMLEGDKLTCPSLTDWGKPFCLNSSRILWKSNLWSVFFFSFLAMPSNIRISVPQSGSEPGPWQWKPRILTTRLLENSCLAGFYWKVVEMMYVCHRPSTSVDSFPYSLFCVGTHFCDLCKSVYSPLQIALLYLWNFNS